MVPKFRGKSKLSLNKLYEIGVSYNGDGFVTGNLIQDGKDSYIVNGVVEVNDECMAIEQCVPVFTDTVMQSTGLKDKNSVEIYCGDIVSVRNHPFQKTEKSGAGIEIDGDYAISWNEGDLTWCAGNLLLARLKPYVTVAGNVWENPELLEVKR